MSRILALAICGAMCLVAAAESKEERAEEMILIRFWLLDRLPLPATDDDLKYRVLTSHNLAADLVLAGFRLSGDERATARHLRKEQKEISTLDESLGTHYLLRLAAGKGTTRETFEEVAEVTAEVVQDALERGAAQENSN